MPDPVTLLGRKALHLNGDSQDNGDKFEIAFDYKDREGDRVLIDTEAGLKNAVMEAVQHMDNRLKLMAHLKKKEDTSNKNAPASKTVSINPNQPFIHGHHYCIKCSVSPIIGQRFHGVDGNGQELDVCGDCKGEYKGLVKACMDANDLQFQQKWRKEHRAGFLEAKTKVQAQRQALKAMRQQKKKLKNGNGWTLLKKDLEEVAQEKTVVDADQAKNCVVINQIQPFIHGNHQCTECGMDPIIGDRFVMDDKELCEKCGQNFGGAEKAEDPNDMSLQMQWRRKYRAVYRPIVQNNKAQRRMERAERQSKRAAERQENRNANRKAARQDKLDAQQEVEEANMEWQEVSNEPEIVVDAK